MDENYPKGPGSSLFPPPVAPYPGWKRRIYHLSRPVTQEDIEAFLGKEDLIIRDNGTKPVTIIHKYGLLEVNLIVGELDVEVWFSPDEATWSAEYLDALLLTRF